MTTTTTEARPRGTPRISLAWIAPAILVARRVLPDRQPVPVDAGARVGHDREPHRAPKSPSGRPAKTATAG